MEKKVEPRPLVVMAEIMAKVFGAAPEMPALAMKPAPLPNRFAGYRDYEASRNRIAERRLAAAGL